MALINTGRDGHVMEIELNRPEKRNALTLEMYRMLGEALAAAERDEALRAVLLRGQPGCFSAGNDLHDFLEQPPRDENAPVFRFMESLTAFPKPLVCAVSGPAIGIGTTLCLHADLVYCGAGASFQLPFVKLGLVPELASSSILPRMLGHARAFELLVVGESFDAQTARQLGIVNHVVADQALLETAREAAAALSRLPAEAVQQAKALLKAAAMKETLQAISMEGNIFSQRLNSPEARQAMAEFFQRRGEDAAASGQRTK